MWKNLRFLVKGGRSAGKNIPCPADSLLGDSSAEWNFRCWNYWKKAKIAAVNRDPRGLGREMKYFSFVRIVGNCSSLLKSVPSLQSLSLFCDVKVPILSIHLFKKRR